MLAQGPTCALARVSYMTSTRAIAHDNDNLVDQFYGAYLVPFYPAIDNSTWSRLGG